jgi:hypothetical protein
VKKQQPNQSRKLRLSKESLKILTLDPQQLRHVPGGKPPPDTSGNPHLCTTVFT